MRPKTVLPVAAVALAAPIAGHAALSGAAASAGPQVQIKNFAFAPKSKTVKPSAMVTWRNADSAPHNATATKKVAGKVAFRTKTGGKNAALKAKAPGKVGSYPYICTIHPQMKGTLVVKK